MKAILLCLPLVLVACTPLSFHPMATPIPPLATLSSPLPVTEPPVETASPLPSPTPPWCPLQQPQEMLDAGGAFRVAYVRDGQLWWAEEGISPFSLIDNGQVEWPVLSDDGQVVVFTQNEGAEKRSLWRVYPQTGEVRLLLGVNDMERLGHTPDALAIQVIGRFLPNSHVFAFHTYPVFDGISTFIPQDLWFLNADNGRLETFSGPKMEFSIFPQGDKIALLGIQGLSLYTLKGEQIAENMVPGYAAMGMGETYAYPQPAWSKDGTQFLVAVPESDDFYSATAAFTVWQVSALDGSAQPLATYQGYAPSVMFSDDLRFLTFWRWTENIGFHEFYLAEVGNPQAMLYTTMTGEFSSFGWRPGTYEFAFWKQHKLWLGKVCEPPTELLGNLSSVAMRWLSSSYFALERPQPLPEGEKPTSNLEIYSLLSPGQPIITIEGITAYDIRWVIPH